MIDIHTHILPGVDDGPAEMEESIEIIKKGIAEGIDTFVLTPHVRDESDWNKTDIIKQTFISLQQECTIRGLSVLLILGAELLLTPVLTERIEDSPFVFILGDKRYVLIELPFFQLPIYTDEVLFHFLTRNIIPIIAHLERYLYLKGKDDIIKRWIKNGIRLQSNSGSLKGEYGGEVKRFVKKLLKKGFIHCLGSDVHSINNNRLSLSEACRIASRLAGKNYFDTFTEKNQIGITR